MLYDVTYYGSAAESGRKSKLGSGTVEAADARAALTEANKALGAQKAAVQKACQEVRVRAVSAGLSFKDDGK